MRRLFLLPLLLLAAALRAADAPALLKDVAERWMDERNRWTFTQIVRETGGDGVVQERVEHFDPTRGDAKRWRLVRLNGHLPDAGEVDAWSKRKNKPRKHEAKSPAEFVDMEHARVLEDNGHDVKIEVPLRKTAGWIFPGDKVNVVLTVNAVTHSLVRAQVAIDGPFNVALGLAKVIDLDFDLEFPPAPEPPVAGAATEAPRGTAYAVVNKLGRRVEYSWSDFALAPPPATASSK